VNGVGSTAQGFSSCNLVLPMSLQALLFDLDGTLIDSDPQHFRAFLAAAEKYGVVFDQAFFDSHMSGHSNADICRTLFPLLSVEEHQRIADEKEAAFRQMLAKKASAIPGIQSLIDWATARDLAFGVVSNAPGENVAAALAALGIAERFLVRISGGMVARGKPDPMPYQAALAQLGISADQAVAFEDTPLGVRAAAGAGISTVGLMTTQPAEALMSAGAALVIDDYTDSRLSVFLDERMSKL